MPKFFRNRRAEEVKKFLEAHGYKLLNHNGDDEIWATNVCSYTVKVPSRNEVIKIGTMSSVRKMIRKCGVGDKDILRWWKDHGYGD